MDISKYITKKSVCAAFLISVMSTPIAHKGLISIGTNAMHVTSYVSADHSDHKHLEILESNRQYIRRKLSRRVFSNFVETDNRFAIRRDRFERRVGLKKLKMVV